MYIHEIINEDIPKSSGGGIHRGLRPTPSTKIGAQSLHNFSYGSVSRSINDFLHKKYRGQDLKKIPDSLRTLDKEFTKLSLLKKEIRVYTGVPQSPSRIWDLSKSSTNTPVKAHLPAFTSTTTNYSIAQEFSGADEVDLKKFTPHKIIGDLAKHKNFDKYVNFAQIIYIIVPAGYNAVSLKNVSGYSRESEILLPRGLDIMINPHPIVILNKGPITCLWGAKVIGSNPIQIVT